MQKRTGVLGAAGFAAVAGVGVLLSFGVPADEPDEAMEGTASGAYGEGCEATQEECDDGSCCDAGSSCIPSVFPAGGFSCQEECEANQTQCGTLCCDEGQNCGGSNETTYACVDECSPTETLCFDANNFLACCGAGETCNAGHCETLCPPDQSLCMGGCCSEGETCTFAGCVPETCELPNIRCGAGCCDSTQHCNINSECQDNDACGENEVACDQTCCPLYQGCDEGGGGCGETDCGGNQFACGDGCCWEGDMCFADQIPRCGTGDACDSDAGESQCGSSCCAAGELCCHLSCCGAGERCNTDIFTGEDRCMPECDGAAGETECGDECCASTDTCRIVDGNSSCVARCTGGQTECGSEGLCCNPDQECVTTGNGTNNNACETPCDYSNGESRCGDVCCGSDETCTNVPPPSFGGRFQCLATGYGEDAPY